MADQLPTTSGADHWDRRQLLRTGAAALGMLALGVGKAEAAWRPIVPPRRVKIINAHTGDRTNVVYFADGTYIDDALKDIDFVMRDVRREKIADMDVRLIDLLARIQDGLETSEPMMLMSGYRSPETNAYLRRHSDGVARNSLHMKAMAADFRVPGRRLRDIAKLARQKDAGGVGLYRSGFVHVDVGARRSWRG